MVSESEATNGGRRACPDDSGEGQPRARRSLARLLLRAPLAILLCLSLLIGIAGAFYVRRQIADSRASASKELQAIADLKAREIASWYDEQLRHARFLWDSPSIYDLTASYLADPAGAGRCEALHDFIAATQTNLRYSRVLLFDRQAELLFVSPETSGWTGTRARRNIAEVLRTGQIVVEDLHLSDALVGWENMDIFVPVMAPADWSGRRPGPIGVLMSEIDPAAFLFPVIQSWPTPSQTAETLLIRREGNEVVFLNELRHRADTALRLRLPIEPGSKLPASAAVTGFQGVMEGLDYRGEPVLAATRGVPGTPWFVVAKVDTNELYAPLHERAWTTGIVVVVLVLCGVLAVAGLEVRRDAHLMRSRLAGERERRALAERIVHLTRQANDIILLMDQDWRILEANDRALRSYGYTLAELQRMRLRDLSAAGSTPETRDQSQPVLPGDGVLAEATHRRQDGSTFPVECSVALVEIGGVKYRHGIFRDVTERKRAEEAQARLEAQLRQAQKLEAIGQLAGGVAHDFNNILTAIIGNCELVMDDLRSHAPADSPLISEVRQIALGAERAAGLTRQLLAFSRRQVAQLETLDLNQAVAQIEPMLRRLLGENIDLLVTPADNLPCVRTDRSQLEQVIVNLAINARDAMPDGGTLSIETTAAVLDQDYADKHADVRPGTYVALIISDTGCGMDARTREHIFEPFFTTKPVGIGTGLGLATVFGIVKQSGGHLSVYSEIGRGTTFRVYLPATSEPAEPRLETTDPGQSLRGSETVLVCEDDEAVRRLTVQVLEGAGYCVLAAASGTEAVSIAAKHHGAISLLITDVIMPDMNGVKLVRSLAATLPDLQVLYVSGYTANVIAHHGVLDPGVEFLEKPFSRGDLLRRVRSLLDQVQAGGQSD